MYEQTKMNIGIPKQDAIMNGQQRLPGNPGVSLLLVQPPAACYVPPVKIACFNGWSNYTCTYPCIQLLKSEAYGELSMNHITRRKREPLIGNEVKEP